MDSDSDSSMKVAIATTPQKSSRNKIRRKQTYCTSWEKSFEFITRSSRGIYFYHCKICSFDGKAGITEIKNHVNSTRHVRNANSLKMQASVTATFKKTSNEIKEAELLIGSFISKHNLAFNLAPHLCALFKRIAKKGKSIESITCGRYKATMIVKNVLAKEEKLKIIQRLQTNKFSLIIDESTDVGNMKQLALVARSFNEVKFEAEDIFLALIDVTEATAENIFNVITNFFNENSILYEENMIGFAADGANNMTGKNNSVYSRFKQKIPHLFCLKCVCHSFNLCASYACSTLPDSLENGLRNIYNYIHFSPKRSFELTAFQEVWNLKPQKLIHPSATRWLAIIECVKRVLKHYWPLRMYFKVEAEINKIGFGPAKNICDWFEDPLTKLYLEFLEFILPLFTNLNLEMQSEEVKIHLLYQRIFCLFSSILSNFIDPKYLKDNLIENLDFTNPEYHLPFENIYLGGKITAYFIENNISAEKVIEFRTRCLKFYIESATQIKTRFPFDSQDIQRLKNLDILDPLCFEKNQSIVPLVLNFPKIIEKDDLNYIDSEFRLVRV